MGRCGNVVIANGCGHFIQKDDPAFVAGEIEDMIKRLEWQGPGSS
jgi:pimeloyl-ACP methyl ester carboxylesterase